MGVHVILDIVPQRIDPAAWAEAFEETRSLLAAHPARLLGYGFRMAAGVRVPVYTRGVEQGGQDPSERRWCVVGDRATLGTGERQRMYRDLGRYMARCPPFTTGAAVTAAPASSERFGEGGPPSMGALPSKRHASGAPAPAGYPASADDILALAVADPDSAPEPRAQPGGRDPGALATVRVFGEGEQSAPCRLALLAAAMVVETRFPRHALVSGHFDREQAEAARRWAKGVLGSAIALPVRVDAWRLIERLGTRLEGEALVRAVDRLYLAEPGAREAALLGVFGRAPAEAWFLGQLREHAAPGEPGARCLAAAYLDATRDLARLLGLACLDARGPRWPADAFVAALASVASPRGVARSCLGEGALEHALATAFGEGAARLRASFRAASSAVAPAQEGASPNRAPVDGGSRPAEETPAMDTLAGVTSPGELDRSQRERLRAVALVVLDVQRRVEDHGGPVSTGAARRTIASLLARSGPTLTEDAWDWIEREDDPELCVFLVALATLEPATPEIAALRRVLLENRALCRYAAAASREEGGASASAEPGVAAVR